MVIIFWNLYGYSLRLDNNTQLQNKLLIPVLYQHLCQKPRNRYGYFPGHVDNFVLDADRTNVEIAIMQPVEDLKKMQQYLGRLYYWFLLGPLITLEWLRRKKKLVAFLAVNKLKEAAYLGKLLSSQG